MDDANDLHISYGQKHGQKPKVSTMSTTLTTLVVAPAAVITIPSLSGMSDSDGNTARLEHSQKEDEWFNAMGPGQPGSTEANEVSDSFIRRFAQLVWHPCFCAGLVDCILHERERIFICKVLQSSSLHFSASVRVQAITKSEKRRGGCGVADSTSCAYCCVYMCHFLADSL